MQSVISHENYTEMTVSREMTAFVTVEIWTLNDENSFEPFHYHMRVRTWLSYYSFFSLTQTQSTIISEVKGASIITESLIA